VTRKFDAQGRHTSAGRRALVAALARMTEREVARLAGCSRSLIGKVATGERPLVKLQHAIGLERGLGISVSSWLSE
jgi:transcriptional regulator with XRE-family HTH domain